MNIDFPLDDIKVSCLSGLVRLAGYQFMEGSNPEADNLCFRISIQHIHSEFSFKSLKTITNFNENL